MLTKNWQTLEPQVILGVTVEAIWNKRTKKIKVRFSPEEDWQIFFGMAPDPESATHLIFGYFLGFIIEESLGFGKTKSSFGGRRCRVPKVYLVVS